MLLASDLKTGKIYKEDGEPYKIEKYSHSKVARSGATIKVKSRSLLTGRLIERSYSSTDKFEEADVYNKNTQYLYVDGTNYVFMDPDTYEQFTMSLETLGDQAPYLKEGDVYQLTYFENSPVSVELPLSMEFEVTYTEPGHKGNTVTNVYKDATLDNGMETKVPLFIKIGDRVKIDTRSGEYVSKA